MEATGEISEAEPISKRRGDKDVAEILSGYTFPWNPLQTIKIGQLSRSPFARRFLLTILAFLILVPLILLLLRPGTTDAAWYSDSWKFRKLLTINSSKVPSTQTNFPVMVSITDQNLKTHAQGTGNDILFTDSTGSTKLSHEIEQFATGSGKLIAWVKIPSLSSSIDTKIYIYYGNPSAPSQQDATNVWDSNFKGVYHLKENPATTCSGTKEVCDSTGNANHADANGSMTNTDQVAGKIDGSLDFDGIDDNIQIAGLMGSPANITLSAWVNLTASDVDGADVISLGDNVLIRMDCPPCGGTDGIYFDGTGFNETITSSNYAGTGWHHIVYVMNDSGDTQHLYVDTVEVAQNTYTPSISYGGTDTYIGKNGSGSTNFDFNGIIDEARITGTARSANWITTEYNNQADPGTFLTIGQQEHKGTPLLHFKFDEGQGTVVNNSGSAGSTANGTLTGMASPATYGSGWTNHGKLGQALNFDGVNDLINAGSPATLDDVSPITVSFWTKLNAFGGKRWIDKFKLGSNGGWRVNYTSNGAINFTVDFDGGTDLIHTSSNNSITTGQWYHVVTTWDGSDPAANSHIYLNGVEVSYQTTTDGAGAPYSDAANDLGIGGMTTQAGFEIDGTMDDVRLYNYALSADEVKLEYNQGKSIVLGSLSTDPDGMTASNSAARAYCPPGDTATCNPPVAYWNFDERTGTSANDSSGNANTGTLTNGPRWVPGKLGQALKFDGVNDYVNITSNTIFNSAALTACGWAKPNSTNTLNIVGRQAGGSQAASEWRLGVNLGGTWRARFTNSGGTQATAESATGFALNTWTHVCTVFDSSNIYLYVNGSETARTALTGSLGSLSVDIQIGAQQSGTTANFNGLLDDVRIYNYARTPAQVTWDYNRGKPLAHWKLDECSGSTAYDSVASPSGKRNDGTITIGGTGSQTSTGNCTTVNTATAWYNGKNGKYNSSLNFDGTDDGIDAGTNSSLNIGTGDYAISMWIKTPSSDELLFSSGGDTSTDQGVYFCICLSGGIGKLQVWVSNGTSYVVNGFSGTQNMWDNQWHHVVWAWDRDVGNKFYIDGVLNASDSSTNSDNIGRGNSSNGIGIQGGGSCCAFNGQLDDVRIYNYAPTQTQIKTIYNENSAIRFGPLTGSP